MYAICTKYVTCPCSIQILCLIVVIAHVFNLITKDFNKWRQINLHMNFQHHISFGYKHLVNNIKLNYSSRFNIARLDGIIRLYTLIIISSLLALFYVVSF
jgi:hypothetical protein